MSRADRPYTNVVYFWRRFGQRRELPSSSLCPRPFDHCYCHARSASTELLDTQSEGGAQMNLVEECLGLACPARVSQAPQGSEP